MKKLLFAILLCVTCSFPIVADEQRTPEEELEFQNEVMLLCIELSESARQVMRARLNGMSARQMITAISPDERTDTRGKRALIFLIEWAFKKPRQYDNESKNRAIVEFESEVLLECLSDYRDL